jgi:hypothetical protein
LNGGVGEALDPASPASCAERHRLPANQRLPDGVGNNGTTALGSFVNQASNTSLADLPNASSVLSALTTATDHLPVVADYRFAALPEPSALVLLLIGIAVAAAKARQR